MRLSCKTERRWGLNFTLVKTEMISGHSFILPPGGAMLNCAPKFLLTCSPRRAVSLVYIVAYECRTTKLIFLYVQMFSYGCHLSRAWLEYQGRGKLLIRRMSRFQCGPLRRFTGHGFVLRTNVNCTWCFWPWVIKPISDSHTLAPQPWC